MPTVTILDSSTPPVFLEGAEGLYFYAGGDTPHVYSAEEVNARKPRYIVPAYVRSDMSVVAPDVDARVFVAQLENVYKFPKNKLWSLDVEGEVNREWVTAFFQEMQKHGYDWGIIYSDKNALGKNGNYWEYVADWTGAPHLYPGTKATQWLHTNNYDIGEFDASLPLYQLNPPAAGKPPAPTFTTNAEARAANAIVTKYLEGK